MLMIFIMMLLTELNMVRGLCDVMFYVDAFVAHIHS